MKPFIQIVFLLTFAVNFPYAQSVKPSPRLINSRNAQLVVTGDLPKILKEASGLEMTKSGYLWSHNDDRFSILYCLDTHGNTIKTIHLNHPNAGWEDLTRDRRGNLYVGSFGNNKNERKNLSIYKIYDPEKVTEKVYTAGVIQYSYPDQTAFPPSKTNLNFDVDAFVSRGDSLYLFTKNRTDPFTGYSKIYRLPQEPGKYNAVLYDSIYLGTGAMMDHWVTSADISPDGKWLALLSHDSIWIITGFEGSRFSSGKIFKINLDHYSHKAGLCFSSNTKLYIVDELEFGFLGGKIYSFDLAPVQQHIQENFGLRPENPGSR